MTDVLRLPSLFYNKRKTLLAWFLFPISILLLSTRQPAEYFFFPADEPKLLNITTTKERAPTRHRIHYLCGHSAVPSTWWIHVVVYAHVGATYMRSNIHTTYSTIFDEGLPDVCKRGQIRHSDMATCTESKINQGNKRKRKKKTNHHLHLWQISGKAPR
jgi:hypothetical protein